MKSTNRNSTKLEVLVVGSGLSAYGACLALIHDSSIRVTVFDIGLNQPYPGQPDMSIPNSVQYNETYFAYGINDKRWPVVLTSKRMCSSHAIGGFSKVYSGSILKPRDSDLIGWPSHSKPTPNDYNAILSSFPIWQLKDELHNLFPCYPVTDDSLVKDNIYIGAPRLALNHARNPNIPFDPTSLFQEWHKKDLISYFSNCYVLEFSRRNKKLIVTAVFNDKEQLFRFDRLYLGAGCINTTSVVDRSLFGNGTRTYQIKTAPIMLSLYLHLPIGRLKRKNSYTEASLSSKSLSEVFVEHRSHATNGLWSHTQISSFNSTILSVIQKSFPLIISKSLLTVQKFLKFSITVFHSSIGIKPTLVSSIALSDLYTKQQFVIILEPDNPSKSYLGNSLRFAIIRKFFLLGLVPLPFGQLIADVMRRNRLGGWHYGGTLPMTDNPSNPAHLKTNGELHGMKGVYIIDSSGFPSVPGSTVALLTMANAYRIANNSLTNSKP